MKKSTLTIRKWLVRGLVVAGAFFGITACQPAHKKSHNSDAEENVSNSAASEVSDASNISEVEDVYGPPVEEIETVYGPPSYFDEIEGTPEIVDEPQEKNAK